MITLARRASMHLILATALLGAQALQGAEYGASGDKRNIITFESRALLETIVGLTSSVTAEITTDLKDVHKTTGRFEVILDDLDSGVKLRDDHMRGSKFLYTEKYPKAIFEIIKVRKATSRKLKDKKPVEVELLGSFTVHGVTRKIGVKATVTYFKESVATRTRLPGNLIHVLAKFSIRLSDFDIPVPKMLIYKLSESVDVTVDVFVSTGGAKKK